jgi:hypothetical protein
MLGHIHGSLNHLELPQNFIEIKNFFGKFQHFWYVRIEVNGNTIAGFLKVLCGYILLKEMCQVVLVVLAKYDVFCKS